ncbi:MAG: hypothetical protein KIT16_04385 [Rhodospirillaceae bacterium]|nr:hypothetical protein [Rhodospirillaceae bacterium]
MNQKRAITDAELFDFAEGRGARAELEARLKEDSALRTRFRRLMERAQQLQALRKLLPAEPLPQDWLDLLSGKGKAG